MSKLAKYAMASVALVLALFFYWEGRNTGRYQIVSGSDDGRDLMIDSATGRTWYHQPQTGWVAVARY